MDRFHPPATFTDLKTAYITLAYSATYNPETLACTANGNPVFANALENLHSWGELENPKPTTLNHRNPCSPPILN